MHAHMHKYIHTIIHTNIHTDIILHENIPIIHIALENHHTISSLFDYIILCTLFFGNTSYIINTEIEKLK